MSSRVSLRTRLLLAVGAITLVALGLADVVVFSSLRSYLYNQVDTSLLATHRAVEATARDPSVVPGDGSVFVPSAHPSDKVGTPPSSEKSGALGSEPDGPGASAFCAVGRENAPGMFIEVRSASGAVVTGPAGREECPAFTPGSATYSPKVPAVITGFQSDDADRRELATYFTVGSTSASGPAFRVRASQLAGGGVLVLAAPIANITSTLSQLLVVELLVTAGALIAAGFLGLWLVRVGLRPLSDVERTADAIAGGDLMHRVPNANARTEVGRLATAFNVMLERVESLVTDLRSSESRLRRFVGDASHELRTPIAAISAYAQLFNKGVSSRPEDIERAMVGIERETDRMGRLVEDLLTLAKLDEGHLLGPEPVELVGLAIEAIETARAVGPSWPVAFVAEEAVEVLGDRSALRQVLDNLLSNVRAHTPEGTETIVTVGETDDEAFIDVVDRGPGIDDKQARLIFERFFRVDPSRSRETGGAGLGLAIVVSIAAAHGGSVSTDQAVGGGTHFRVTLPTIDNRKPLDR